MQKLVQKILKTHKNMIYNKLEIVRHNREIYCPFAIVLLTCCKSFY